MNATRLLLPALFFASPGFAAQIVLPEPLPVSRYEKMLEGSPFALATAPVAAPDKGPGPFANLFVAAIYQLKDAEGKLQDAVTIKSRGDNATFTLTAGQEGKDGLQLVNIEWSDKVGASKVGLKKGTEFGTIEFDQANLQAAPQQPATPRTMGPGGVPVPGVPGANQRTGARMPVVPRPTTVAPVPTQPAPAAVPQLNPQGVPQPQVPNTGVAPRRVRVINSKP